MKVHELVSHLIQFDPNIDVEVEVRAYDYDPKNRPADCLAILSVVKRIGEGKRHLSLVIQDGNHPNY